MDLSPDHLRDTLSELKLLPNPVRVFIDVVENESGLKKRKEEVSQQFIKISGSNLRK